MFFGKSAITSVPRRPARAGFGAASKIAVAMAVAPALPIAVMTLMKCSFREGPRESQFYAPSILGAPLILGAYRARRIALSLAQRGGLRPHGRYVCGILQSVKVDLDASQCSASPCIGYYSCYAQV